MKMSFSEAYDKIYPREKQEPEKPAEEEKMVEDPEKPADEPREEQ
jgi:hypothetical protein